MKVLLIAPSVPNAPLGAPSPGASGRSVFLADELGNRLNQIRGGLANAGIETVLALPDRFRGLAPQETETRYWGATGQEELIDTLKPDAVLSVGGWEHLHLEEKPPCPLILDLPRPVFGVDGRRLSSLSAEKKIRLLSFADCILTTTRRLRSYFAGWLVQAGRVVEKEDGIRVVPPVGVAERLERQPGAPKAPRFIAFAETARGDTQWDTLIGIAEGIIDRGEGELEIVVDFAGEARSAPEGSRAQDAILHLRALSSEAPDRVRCVPPERWVRQRGILTRPVIAVHVPERTVFQELTIEARDLHLLASGVPLIHSNYSELSTLLWEMDAGWVIEPGNRTELSALLEELYHSRSAIEDKERGASLLVAEHFDREKAIQPLLEFLKDPRRAHAGEPVFGTAYRKPSPFTGCGKEVSIRLSPKLGVIRQRFTLPGEGIAALELPVDFRAALEVVRSLALDLRVVRRDGRRVAARSYSGPSLLSMSALEIKLPALRAPKGGEELVLEVELKARRSGECTEVGSIETEGAVVLRGLSGQVYPFAPLECRASLAENGADLPADVCLALRFLPMELSPSFRTKLVIGRGFDMLRRGDFGRIYRAITRRVPGVYYGLRRQLLSRFS